MSEPFMSPSSDKAELLEAEYLRDHRHVSTPPRKLSGDVDRVQSEPPSGQSPSGGEASPLEEPQRRSLQDGLLISGQWLASDFRDPVSPSARSAMRPFPSTPKSTSAWEELSSRRCSEDGLSEISGEARGFGATSGASQETAAPSDLELPAPKLERSASQKLPEPEQEPKLLRQTSQMAMIHQDSQRLLHQSSTRQLVAPTNSPPTPAGLPLPGSHPTSSPPVSVPAPMRIHFSLSGDLLDLVIAPGDVLLVRGSGRLAEIGNAGGFMGHVLVVIAQPRSVLANSEEAHHLQTAWPPGAASIWRIPTIESTRRETGLYQTESLAYVERGTRRLMLIGELELDGEVSTSDKYEQVEIWQSPEEVRQNLRPDVMTRVVEEMRRKQANWSAATAARAVLKAALIQRKKSAHDTLQEIRACWDEKPICTSVVIVFWQRYLEKIAALPPDHKERREELFSPGEVVQYWSASHQIWVQGVVNEKKLDPHGEVLCYNLDVKLGALPCNIRKPRPVLESSEKAVDLILQHMPLKADRALPGDLMNSLSTCCWMCIQQVPMIFSPSMLPPPMPFPWHSAPQVPPPRDAQVPVYSAPAEPSSNGSIAMASQGPGQLGTSSVLPVYSAPAEPSSNGSVAMASQGPGQLGTSSVLPVYSAPAEPSSRAPARALFTAPDGSTSPTRARGRYAAAEPTSPTLARGRYAAAEPTSPTLARARYAAAEPTSPTHARPVYAMRERAVAARPTVVPELPAESWEPGDSGLSSFRDAVERVRTRLL